MSSEYKDMSVLRPPLHIGKPGLHQLIDFYRTGTAEIRRALAEECDVILECKVCRSMFRALPNFLAHKRVYCLANFTDPKVGFVECRPEQSTMIVQPTDPPTIGIPEEMLEHVDGRSEEHSEDYEFYTKVVEREKWKEEQDSMHCTVQLTPIPSNPNAMKQQVMNDSVEQTGNNGKTGLPSKSEMVMPAGNGNDKHSQKKSKGVKMVALKLSDKLKNMEGCSFKPLKCKICKLTYSTPKSLYRHMMSFHSEKRTVYPCPYCKSRLTQLWGLTRHLEKNHGKSKQQVEKMREKLKKRAIQVRTSPPKLKTRPNDTKDSSSSFGGSATSSPSASPKKMDTSAGSLVNGKQGLPFAQIGSGFQLHKCEQCGRNFGKKDSLRRHMPFCMHHKKQISPVSSPNKTDGKASTPDKKENLSKTAQIDILAGISKEDLKKVHALIDEDSHLCVKCNKHFGSVSSLHRHAVRHLGWKRFKCALCKFQCYNRSECKSHLQKVHKNIEAHEILTYVLDLEPDETKCGQAGPDLAEVPEGQSKRSLAFKNKTSPRQLKISDCPGVSKPDNQNKGMKLKHSPMPQIIQKLDFRGAEISNITDKMLLATTTVNLEDLDVTENRRTKALSQDSPPANKPRTVQGQSSTSKTKTSHEENLTAKGKTQECNSKSKKNSTGNSEHINGNEAEKSPQVGLVRSKRLGRKSSPGSSRSQSPVAQTCDKGTKSPVLKTGTKRKAQSSDGLQVLRTRSGVLYKKPSLEELLKQKQAKPVNSCEDVEEDNMKRLRRNSPKPSKASSTTDKKTDSSKQGSTTSSNSTKDDEPSQTGINGNSSRSRLASPTNTTLKDKEVTSPPANKETGAEPLKTQSFYAKSGLPPGPQKTVVVPGSCTIVSSPVKSCTASDLIKQNPSLKSRAALSSPDRKAFDLSKAKVILSPLSTTSSMCSEVEEDSVSSAVLSPKVVASVVSSPPQGMTARPITSTKTSTATKVTSSGKSPKQVTVSSPPALPRLAPKPLPRPQKKDFIILVENPTGMSEVVEAMNKSAEMGTKLSTDCMYVLKDDMLTPVSRTNPVVTGVSNMGYSFAINTSSPTTTAQKVFAITNLAPPTLPLMTTHIITDKPLTRSGQKTTDSLKSQQ